jgi:hypothetical protein
MRVDGRQVVVGAVAAAAVIVVLFVCIYKLCVVVLHFECAQHIVIFVCCVLACCWYFVTSQVSPIPVPPPMLLVCQWSLPFSSPDLFNRSESFCPPPRGTEYIEELEQRRQPRLKKPIPDC